MPLVNTQTLATAATATGTFGPVTPVNNDSDNRIALVVTTSATSGSPSLIYKLQGTVDGTNYVDIVLLPSTTDTAASSFTTSALGTVVYFVAQAHIRRYSKYQLVATTVTTTTFSANLVELV